MKCVNCGEKTDKNQIICAKCRGVDSCLHFLTAHVCGSFMQVENDVEGSCRWFLDCEPIKRALKSEALIDSHLGHVICPYASVNLSSLK